MRPSRTFRSAAPIALALAAWAALPSLEWCPLSWDALRVLCESEAKCALAPGGGAGVESCGAASPTCDQAARGCAAGCDVGSPLCDPTPDAPTPIGDRAWCIHPPLDGIAGRELVLRAPLVELPGFLGAELASAEDPPSKGLDWPDTEHSARVCADAHAPPPARAPPRADSNRVAA